MQHVTTLSGVRGTGGVVPALWYVYKEIDSLIQQRQFFSRGGRGPRPVRLWRRSSRRSERAQPQVLTSSYDAPTPRSAASGS